MSATPVASESVPLSLRKPHESRPATSALVAGAIAAFAVVFMALGVRLDLWMDEAYSLHATSDGISRAVATAIGFEQQPPLYFALLALWRSIDPALWFARAFSVLCAVGTLLLAVPLAKRYVPRISPVWIVIVLAFAPFLGWCAVTARAYGLAVFLSALAMLYFYDAFATPKPSRGAVLAYVVVALAGMYTEYYFGSLLLGQGIAVVLRYRARLRAYVLAAVAIVLGFAPLAAIVVQQVKQSAGMIRPSQRAVADLVGTLVSFALPHHWIAGYFPQHSKVLSALYLIVAAIPIGFAIAGGRLRPERSLRTLAIILATMTAFFALLVAVHRQVAFPRHLAVMLVPMVLLVFALLSGIASQTYRRRALAAFALGCAVFGTVETAASHAHLSNFGDWRRTAAYLRAHVAPGETVLVYNAELTLPLSYYDTGPSPLLALPAPLRFDHYDVHRFGFHDAASVRAAFEPLKVHTSIWLIEQRPCSNRTFDLDCRDFDAYVSSHFAVVSAEHFYGTDVLRLRTVHPKSGADAR